MITYLFFIISEVLSLLQVRVAEEKAADAPACLESLSWFCGRKKHEIVEKLRTLPGFVNFVETMLLLSEPLSWTQTAAGFMLSVPFFGESTGRISCQNKLPNNYCSKSKEMSKFKCYILHCKLLTAQS